MIDVESRFAATRQSEPYLDDAGFTAAIMAELPSRTELPLWLKNIILLAATALGSAIAVWQLPPVLALAEKAASVATNLEFIAIAALGIYAASLVALWVARKELV